MAENFPQVGKEKEIQVQESQGDTNNINPERPTLGHIIIKT